jgi:hypothetical protein
VNPDQPKPTGEWTAAIINTQVGYDDDRQGEREAIAKFHNAALAAEREKRENDSINFELVRQEHEKQLAAERAEAQKPLVEALRESNGVLKVIYNYGFSDNSKGTIGEVIDRNEAALAKAGKQ